MGVELERRGGVDGLPGRAAADGVPHCEGRRLASRGGGRGREEVGGGGVNRVGGGWGGGVQGLEGHCSQSASRHQERDSERDRGEGLWWETGG